MHGTLKQRFASDFKGGVFVRAHVSHDTADAIAAWAKTLKLPQGAKLVDPDEYHATLIHSKTPFDYSNDTHDQVFPSADATNKRLEVLGADSEPKVLTLRFDSTDLKLRHDRLKEQGGKSDFPEFKPHITIAENVPADHDVSQHPVFDGPIVFTSESAEPIEKDKSVPSGHWPGDGLYSARGTDTARGDHGRQDEKERARGDGESDASRKRDRQGRDGGPSRLERREGDRDAARRWHVKAGDYDESKHPRDDHGRWTDAGGGGDGGDDTVTPHASGRIHELSANGAPRFHGAISAAKAASPYGAAVHVYPVEDYRNTRMFVTPDNKAGFALKGNDIVSLFKHPDHAEKGFAQTALALATEQGGQRLDAFDTQLPYLYSRSGFRAVARLAWNDQYKPDGWEYKTFGEFNGGRPDVVFMVHDPENAQPYKPGDGKRVASYEEGVAEQEKALASQGSKIPGLPSNVKVHDLNLNNAIDRGVWDITAKPRGYTTDKPGEAYNLSIRAKQIPGIEEYKRRDTDKVASLYDPKLATLEVMDKGESFEWTLAKLKPGYSNDIHPLDDKDVIYRGMSAEEYRNILATGEVTSRGEYNLEGQEGLTYWSTQVDTAQAYANGFAPWAYKPTFEAPAYVIATKRPDEKDIRVIPGTGENEVGVAAPIKASDIVAVWRGQAYENRPGELDLVRIGYGGDDYRSGSGVGTSTSVAWIRDDAPGAKKDWDESKHPRVPAGSPEGGQFGEGGGGGGGDDHPGAGYSKDAWVDKHGVIHTKSVYDAQRALFENRKVELKQPKQVSTLIHELAKTINRYRAQGETPPLFDLCNVTVKGTNLFCADTKGIPRVEMPQMNTKQTKLFIKYLKDKGYDVEKDRELASHLRATQNQLSGEKVVINLERNKDEPERLEKRLVVSRDNYILDGHHHWAAKLALDAEDNKLNDDTKMRVSRVDTDIITLLDEAEKFTGGKGHKPAGEKDFRGPLAMELELTIEECEAIWLNDEAGLELGLTDREIELLLLEWDESKHPRVPAGSPEGGQFGSGGGGGGESESTSEKPAGKKKGSATMHDFTLALPVDRETDNDKEKQQKFLTLWNDRIGEAPKEFREHFLGGVNSSMSVRYDDSNDEMSFQGDLKDAGGNKIGTYTRDINFKRNYAESSYFSLNHDQGKGIGKDVLRGNVETYQQLGLDKVIVHANIDVGGYAWAKYGYVPNDDSWDTLRGNIEQRLDGSGTRYSDYEPSSWEEMSSENQSKVEDDWREQAYDEVYDSEVENWHESGRALFDAKTQVQDDYEDARGKLEEGATEYNADDPRYRWAVNALDKARTEANIPFTTEQLLKVTEVGYDDSREEGRADPDITIDDSKLPDDGKALTDEMVDAIDKAMIDSFNGHAQDEESAMDPPAYVADSVGDLLSEIWSSMRDRDKFEWASRHSEITPIKMEDDSGDGEGAALDDLNPTEEKLLRKLIASDDPKTIWAIADATFGKKVLLGTDWNGALNFKDRESMERFNAYVGRKKAA